MIKLSLNSTIPACREANDGTMAHSFVCYLLANESDAGRLNNFMPAFADHLQKHPTKKTSDPQKDFLFLIGERLILKTIS